MKKAGNTRSATEAAVSQSQCKSHHATASFLFFSSSRAQSTRSTRSKRSPLALRKCPMMWFRYFLNNCYPVQNALDPIDGYKARILFFFCSFSQAVTFVLLHICFDALIDHYRAAGNSVFIGSCSLQHCVRCWHYTVKGNASTGAIWLRCHPICEFFIQLCFSQETKNRSIRKSVTGENFTHVQS